MNLLTRLFSPKSKVDSQTVSVPSPELFVDSIPPSSLNASQTQRSIVSEFMSQDFHSAGARDGYNFHSSEVLESRKKEIKSRFLFQLDQAMAQKKEKDLLLRNLMIDLSGVSEETREKLSNTIEKIDDDLNTLSLQKELSAMDEGWVMEPIRKYHLGFIQGMKEFVETEELLGSNSIFNLQIIGSC